MTYAGARGQTAQQMADTLHFTLGQDRLHPAFNALDLELASRGHSSVQDVSSGKQVEQPALLEETSALGTQLAFASLKPRTRS